MDLVKPSGLPGTGDAAQAEGCGRGFIYNIDFQDGCIFAVTQHVAVKGGDYCREDSLI